MEVGESASKRVKLSPPHEAVARLDHDADYVAFDLGTEEFHSAAPEDAPTAPRAQSTYYSQRRREDPRNKLDKPKSKHVLPGNADWVLIKTKLGRRFVHNVITKQSLWRIPRHLEQAVEDFVIGEEKQRNQQWSEEQLKLIRPQQSTAAEATSITNDERSRRRRSESLQREDEEAMMAELAAQAEHKEEQDVKQTLAAVSDLEPRGYVGAASDSEFEYVEVTDTEGEGGDESDDGEPNGQHQEAPSIPAEPGPVDFGEEDIAYQLAMMGESYGLDPEEYDNNLAEGDDELEEDGDVELSGQEAIALFCQMLEEYGVSPFTPWDKVIADASSSSIVFDDRYTLLRSSQERKDAWDNWSRTRAAEIKQQREMQEKQDPRVVYLKFLSATASTKLYWPEFKRKYKREPEMNDRSLQEKDRERYYRDLVAKLKLPENKRRDEVMALLKTFASKTATPSTQQLPNKALTNVLLYALSVDSRDEIIKSLHFEIPAVLQA